MIIIRYVSEDFIFTTEMYDLIFPPFVYFLPYHLHAVNSNLEAVASTTPINEGGSVLSVNVNLQKMFAFVEFYTVTQAVIALQLNGIFFNGSNLKIGRPRTSGVNAPSVPPVGGVDLSMFTPVLSASAMAAAKKNQALGSVSTLVDTQSSVTSSASVGNSVDTAVALNLMSNSGNDDQPLEEDERFSLRGV